MTKILFVLLLGVCVCLAQPFTTRDVPFMSQGAGVSSPTNLPGGYIANGWWEPSLGYATNTGVATLSNLTSVGASFNLTNTAGAGSPLRQVGNLNGLDTIYFDGSASSKLDCFFWTNTSPWEVFMVLSVTNVSTGAILSGLNVPAANNWSFDSTDATRNFRMSQGATVVVSDLISNRYIVVDCVFSNANSAFYTNNVNATNVNTGTFTQGLGLRVGADRQGAGANEGRFSLACMFTFTNQLLNAAARLAAYQYCTNRFAIVP